MIFILAAACLIYNGIYFAFCLRRRQNRAAIGTAVSMLLVTAGMIMFTVF